LVAFIDVLSNTADRDNVRAEFATADHRARFERASL
jgi:hypothetical protein